jgi:branched-chain amino acid aminotransferase group I
MDLAQRRHQALGRSHHPRDVACPALRLVGLRRHPHLPDAQRPGDLPPDRPQHAPVRLGQDLRHGDAVLAGADQPGCRDVIHANNNTTDYLRPVAYRGLGGFGLSADTPTDLAVATWKMGQYLGASVLEQGIDACVSSWQRFAPNTIPAGAKAGGNYLSGQLVAREARRLGFGEGIALASTGLLSEGAGENLFLVFDGALHTTPVSAALLNGITRNTIITLARDAGIEVVERDLPREYLYLCDELFMCGTAAEITPIRSVDGRQVGTGKPGRSPAASRSCSSACSKARRRTSAAGWKRCKTMRRRRHASGFGVVCTNFTGGRASKVRVATTPRCSPGRTRTSHR